MSRRKDAFLIHLWSEEEQKETTPAEWRGSVEHLATKRRLYFSDVIELMEFLAPWTSRRGIG